MTGSFSSTQAHFFNLLLAGPSKVTLCAPMGTFCSINTGSESDEHDKDSEDSPSHNSHAAPLQHLKMTTRNHRGQSSRHEKTIKPFKFQFQDDIAGGANDGANRSEAEASKILAHMREEDNAGFAARAISPGQHFLHVRDLLEDTRLFQVARMVPKGAHLHLHFNSTLLPVVLLGFAKDMVNMYIWSDHRLLTDSDFRDCKLEFSLRNLGQVRKEMHAKAAESGDSLMCQRLTQAESLSDEAAKTRAYDRLGPDMFSPTYKNGRKDKGQQVEEMRYQYFRERWDEKALGDCDEWLISKLTFSKEEVDSFFVEADGDELESESETERSPTQSNASPISPIKLISDGVKPQDFDEEQWVLETRKRISDSKYKGNRTSARK